MLSKSPVHAQEEAGSSEYRALIDQALSEFGHKNWPEARVLFRRAHELNPNARTLRGIGMTSYEMRDYVAAVLQLSAALEERRQPLTDAQRKEVEQLLARSRTFVGAYTLTVEPEQAQVTLDGAALVHDAAGRVLVPFGEHTLHASAPDYLADDTKLSVQGGEQKELHVTLRKPSLAPAVRASEPPANPFGKQHSTEPVYTKTGGLKYSYIALGATAAFGAAALGTWFVGQGKLNDLDDQCAERATSAAPCVRGGVDIGSVKTLERTTNALLGLTGAALVTTVVLATFEWPRERRSLALDVGPQRLSLHGSF
ncbi:MAG TPA: hypothetical protein VFX59_29200 [Polyangiales bacterium]|nr:hypothetical protein [Polyangiales bacterium]